VLVVKRKYSNLADYFKQNPKVTQGALARRLGVTPAYVSLLASGDRQPALKLALAIESLTGVSVESLVSSDERAAS
jgi:DNA-binding transcriptional regulator YdaS (Cro superfamily)